jgi:gliding motility-associated-like protein
MQKKVGLLTLLLSTLCLLPALGQQVLHTLCIDNPTASYSVTPNPGSTYQWVATGGTIVSGQGSPNATITWNPTPGPKAMLVRETNEFGCVGEPKTATILMIEPPDLDISATAQSVCEGELVGFTLSGTSQFDQITWSNGETGTAINFPAVQTELVSATVESVCGIYEVSTMLQVQPLPNLSISRTGNIEVCGENGATLTANTNATDIVWSPSGETTRSIEVFEQRIFSVQATLNGCSRSDSVFVRSCIVVYNTFTPDNDGFNDTFEIEYLENYPDNEITIFNRWGDRVFRMKNYDNSWDGTFNGRPLPVGSYYYSLDLRRGGVLSGYINLLRR